MAFQFGTNWSVLAERTGRFWATVIVVAILAYVVLDGFDLGVGILFGTTRDTRLRDEMIASISPFWDGNETWLIVVGASLFAAFPTVYAVFLAVFYIPVLLLLLALIFRGVAFEFRARGIAAGLWDGGFAAGSVIAAFVQGAAVGAMIRGIPVANGQFSGGSFDWVAPLPIICGVGLVLGYALMGAGWLVLKSDDPPLRDWARDRILVLAKAVVAVLVVAAVLAFFDRARMTGSLFLDRPWGFIFALIGVAAIAGIFTGVRQRRELVAVRHDRRALRRGLSLARGHVLAVHDPLQRDRRFGGRAGSFPLLLVLGRRPVRAAGDRRLHGRRLLDVSRQTAQGLRRAASAPPSTVKGS